MKKRWLAGLMTHQYKKLPCSDNENVDSVQRHALDITRCECSLTSTQPDLRIIWRTKYPYITNLINLICRSWVRGSDTEHRTLIICMKTHFLSTPIPLSLSLLVIFQNMLVIDSDGTSLRFPHCNMTNNLYQSIALFTHTRTHARTHTHTHFIQNFRSRRHAWKTYGLCQSSLYQRKNDENINSLEMMFLFFIRITNLGIPGI